MKTFTITVECFDDKDIDKVAAEFFKTYENSKIILGLNEFKIDGKEVNWWEYKTFKPLTK